MKQPWLIAVTALALAVALAGWLFSGFLDPAEVALETSGDEIEAERSGPARGAPETIAPVEGRASRPDDSAYFPLHAVRGRLLDARTGEPVAGAAVTLLQAGSSRKWNTRSQASGRFRLDDVPDGITVSLVVRSARHAPLAEEDIPITGPRRIDLGDIELTIGGKAVSGIVVDASGAPIGGANVYLMPHRAVGSYVDLDYFRIVDGIFGEEAALETTRTGRDGTFRFRRAMSRDYVVGAFADGHQAGFSRGFHAGRARPLRIVLAAGRVLAGTVKSSTGGAVPGAEVVALPRGRKFSYVIKTFKVRAGDDGSYRLDSLGDGEYTLFARAPGHAVVAVTGVRARDEPLDVTLTSVGSGCTVRAVDGATGEGLAGVEIALLGQGNPAYARGRTDRDGILRIDRLPGGVSRYTAVARKKGWWMLLPDEVHAESGPGGLTVSSGAVLTPSRALHTGIKVAAPHPVHEIPMGRGAVVSGRVVDLDTGAGIEGATVRFLAPKLLVGAGRRAAARTRTAADGTFTLTDVPPGPVRIVAWARGYASPLEPDGAGPHDFGAATASGRAVEPGGRMMDWTVGLVRGATLTGVVVRPDDTPVEHARVTWRRETGGQAFLSYDGHDPDQSAVITDEEGRFTFRGVLRAPKVKVTASCPEAASTRSAVVDTRNAPGPLRLVLLDAASIEGRLLGADGQPAAGIALAWLPAGVARDGRAWSTNHDHRTVTTSADGTFHIDSVPTGPGAFHLAPGVDALLEPCPLKKIDAGRRHRVQLELARRLAISGRVVKKDGKPATGHHVTARVVASLHPMNAVSAAVQEDGNFLLRGLAPGTYTLFALPTVRRGSKKRISYKRVDGIEAGTEDVLIRLDY